jgi:diaminopimelate decarboxylase
MRAHHHGEPASLPGMTDTVHAVHSLPSGQLTTTYPPLTPLLDEAVAQLVQESPVVLHALVERYGSPLNLVWPHLLANNARKLTETLRRNGVRHEVFYGAKVNKSHAFIHAAVQAGVGVDVSSFHEATDALNAGADPARLCATGPAKTRVFHELLVAQGALISIDSRQELHDLEDCLNSRPPSSPARVLLRYRPVASGSSRFGMGPPELQDCLHWLAGHRGTINFEGFHFHLGGL